MKKIIIIIFVIVLVGLGLYANQSKPENTTSSSPTREQAVENVKKLPEVQQYLEDVPNGKVDVDNKDEDEYLIHVYEIKNSHTATFNWYTVSIKDGKVESQLPVFLK